MQQVVVDMRVNDDEDERAVPENDNNDVELEVEEYLEGDEVSEIDEDADNNDGDNGVGNENVDSDDD